MKKFRMILRKPSLPNGSHDIWPDEDELRKQIVDSAIRDLRRAIKKAVKQA